MSKNRTRVVITGRNLSSSLGTELDAHFAAIRNGNPSFRAVLDPIIADDAFLVVGECPKPVTKKLPDRKVQKVTTRKDIIGLLSAFAALEEAGIKKGDVDPERIGIFTGTASTHISDLDPYFELLKECDKGDEVDVGKFGQNLLGNVNPMVMMQTLMNNVLCYVSIPMDFRGVNANFIDYQVSGLRAVGEAYWSIVEGRADQVVAGGISGAPDYYHAQEGIEVGYLAPTVSSEEAEVDVVKPYDQNRQGTVLSEGAAFVVLESLESAQSRGAAIYGEVLDFSLTGESSFTYMKVDDHQGTQRAFENLLKKSSLSKNHIQAVYAHGNGAKTGDDMDLLGMDEAFKGRNKPLPVVSIKGVLGETNEASGVMSLVDCLKSFEDQQIPGTHGLENICRDVKSLRLSSESQNIDNSPIVVSTKSFSGAHALLLVGPPPS